MSSHAAWRDDFHPVRCPANTGEFANVATNAGPAACRVRQRSTNESAPAAWPASTQGCTAAVEHIIVRPDALRRSK